MKMDVSSFDIEQQFHAIAAALGAERGDDEYYRGIIERAPFLFKMMSAEPPGYMLKFRMIERCKQESDWHARLGAEYAGAGIRCELDGEYLYLWIDDATSLTADSIAALARTYVRDHAAHFPTAEAYCYHCKEVGSAALVQSSSMIVTACDGCLALKLRAKLAESQHVNPSHVTRVVLLPLAMLVSAAGWAVFWHAYNAAFELANSEFLYVPGFLVVVTILIVGGGLGWPIGWLLHQSGLVKWLSPVVLATAATIVVVVGGELLYAAYAVVRATGILDPLLTLRIAPRLAFGNSWYAACKLLVAFGLGAIIRDVARPKAVPLRV